MTFEEFTNMIVADVKVLAPDLPATIREVEKLQGQSYTGLMIGGEGEPVSVSLSLNEYFNRMEQGASYEAILSQLMRDAETALESLPEFPVNALGNYDQMKHLLVCQAIPTDANREMLADIPHQEIEDMSIVYRFRMESSDRGTGTILVTNAMLETYGITADELAADAALYAPENNPLNIRSMTEVLNEMMGGMGVEELLPDDPNNQLFVATVEDKMNGAGILAYPDFFDRAAETMGGNFYLLPSSIHELLLVKEMNPHQAQELNAMVQSVNATEVSISDRLSDQAFHYDSVDRVFETALHYEARVSEREMSPTPERSEAEVPDPGKVTVLLVEPECYPRPVQIGTELSDLQQAVDGFIEYAYPADDDSVAYIMNEEGKINGLPLNRALYDDRGEMVDIVAGSFLVVGLGEENITSLTPQQMEHFEEKFHQPEVFLRMGNRFMAVPMPDRVVEAKARENLEKLGQGKDAPEKKARPKHKEHEGH